MELTTIKDFENKTNNDLIYNRQANILASDFNIINSILCEKGKFKTELIRVNEDGSLFISWMKEEDFSIEKYAEDYKIEASNLIFDWLQEKNLEITEEDDLQDFINNNEGDYYSIVEEARPDFIYNYEVLGFFTSNFSCINDFEFNNNNLDCLRFACLEAIEQEVSIENIKELIIEKQNNN